MCRPYPSTAGPPGPLPLLVGLLLLPGLLSAAANDGVIEPDGVWHGEYDVTPENPGSGDVFAVELRAFRSDLVSAALHVVDDDGTRVLPMEWVSTEEGGRYDVWRAEVGPVDSDYLYYHFQLRDGDAYATFARSGFHTGDPPGGDFLLNLTTLGAFPLGATVDGDGTVFRVWAPGAEQAEVEIDPLTPDSVYVAMERVEGFWQVRVPGVGHGRSYKFRFLRDGNWLYRNDPRAKWLHPGLDHSIVLRPDYPWTDGDWTPPGLADAIISEAHVGTFSGRGDGASGHPASYRDLADRHIAHLVESGINVLQLMPVQEFPGELSWGYNPAFLFAPESAYGDPEDFKYLVDRCHRAGIAVWLDVVLNHFDGPNLDGNLGDFDGDDIYFYSPGSGYRDTGYGPRPDYGRVEVRDYLVDSMRFLVEEYHIDGFRLDHTNLIKVNTDGWHLLKEISQMRARLHPQVVLTAEQWPNDAAVTRPVRWGGAGLDAQWSDIFHDNSRAALNQLAFGDPSIGAVADGLNHFGFGQTEMINFIESHDEARESPPDAYEGRIVQVADNGNPHSSYGLGRGKLFYGLTLYGAAVPLLLYGQEIATEIGFGDKQRNKIPWEYRESYAEYFAACRDMTWLRRKSPALRADSWQNVYHVNEEANVLVWERARDGHFAVVVANFSNTDFGEYWIGLPVGGTWYETINTAAARYGGSGAYQNGSFEAFDGGSQGMPYSAPVQLPKHSLLVLTKHDYDLTPGDLDADNDGVEDAWEREHDYDPNSEQDAVFDSDGDGSDTRSEFLFGTDPWLPDLPPRLTLRATPGGMELAFPTIPDRAYTIGYSPDLVRWFHPWPAQSTRGAAEDGLLEMLDPGAADVPVRFYRVDVASDR